MARRLPILDFHPHHRISRGHLLDSVLGAYTIAECEWRRSLLLALPTPYAGRFFGPKNDRSGQSEAADLAIPLLLISNSTMTSNFVRSSSSFFFSLEFHSI